MRRVMEGRMRRAMERSEESDGGVRRAMERRMRAMATRMTTASGFGTLIFAVQRTLDTASKEIENGSYCSGNERCEVDFISESKTASKATVAIVPSTPDENHEDCSTIAGQSGTFCMDIHGAGYLRSL